MTSEPHFLEGNLRTAQREYRKSREQYGMLPVERQGIGLLLLVVAFASLIGAIALFFSGGSKLIAGLLLADAGIANIMNGVRTKRWLEAQPDYPQATRPDSP